MRHVQQKNNESWSTTYDREHYYVDNELDRNGKKEKNEEVQIQYNTSK